MLSAYDGGLSTCEKGEGLKEDWGERDSNDSKVLKKSQACQKKS